MSALKLSQVWRREFAGPLHHLVMLRLADNADDHGLVYVPVAQFSARLNMTEAQLSDVLDDLVRAGQLYRLVPRKSPAGHWYIVLVGTTEADVIASMNAQPSFAEYREQTLADLRRLSQARRSTVAAATA